MTNLLEMFRGKPKTSDRERQAKIEDVVDKIAIKHSIPQHAIRKIILEWMQFQAEYLKL